MEKVFSTSAAEITSVLMFINDLSAETDRAAVILSASKIDILLYQILQKYLLPCPSAGDELFEGDGPLSSLRAKIDLSFRLGLIDGACSRTLHLIRKIRNDFAHELAGGSLDTGAHRDRIKVLMSQFDGREPYEDLKKMYLKGREAKPGDEYRILASMIPIYLTMILNSLRPVSPLDIPLSIFQFREDASPEPKNE